MFNYFNVAILLHLIQLLISAPISQIEEDDTITFLKEFGYISSTDGRSADTQINFDLLRTNALKKFQEYSALPVTGILDGETKQKMEAPRCGVPDIGPNGISDPRNGYAWPRSRLTWAVKEFYSHMSTGYQRLAVDEAFKVWSKVTPLDFIEVQPSVTDIDIPLEFGSLKHGDSYPFDGPGRVLAHAFGPNDGRTHFDADEDWVYNEDKSRTIELVTVAVHEIGHVLGLSHSTDPDAIMAPYYQKFYDQAGNLVPRLNSDDISRIQSLYGSHPGFPTPTMNPSGTTEIITETSSATESTMSTSTTTDMEPIATTPSTKSSTRSTIDTTASIQTSSSVALETTTSSHRRKITPQTRRPSKRQDSCPSTIDATVTVSRNGHSAILLFSGSQVYEFTEQNGVRFVGEIRDLFENAPQHISGVLYAHVDNLILLLDDRNVYGYRIDQEGFTAHQDFPKTLTIEISDYVTVFAWTDGNLIFVGRNNDFSAWDDGHNYVTFSGLASDYFPEISTGARTSFSYNGKLHFLEKQRVYVMNDAGDKIIGDKSEFEFFKCYARF